MMFRLCAFSFNNVDRIEKGLIDGSNDRMNECIYALCALQRLQLCIEITPSRSEYCYKQMLV